ncbi:MAG TPA: hypothetical protein PLK35_02050 [Candidatus Moranbacteria bacterium]|nr:hypothetical protein [Candidatus Moranbacteria bacterium]
MEKLKRKLFFWTLVLLFFVTTPIIILHARGYRFDLSRGVFVHSGTIAIKSNPQSVDVSLNGELFEAKKIDRINNSYNLTGLLPSDYEIKVTYSGFRSWSKKADVHSGVASEFWNILLVRENYEREILIGISGVDRFFMSPKNQYIVYTENAEEGLKTKLFNIKDNTVEREFSFPGWKILDETKKENIEWSPEEDYLSVPVEKTELIASKKKTRYAASPVYETRYAYFIVDPENETSFNLNEFLGKNNITSVRWDPKDKDYLFFLSEGSLFRVNIKDASDIINISPVVSAFNLTRSNIYYLGIPNNLVYKSSLDGKSEKEQITNNFPDLSSSPVDKMIIYDEDRIAFINQNKDLFIYNFGEHDTYFKKIGSLVEGVHFSDDGKKMLFWSDNEISAYFLRDWDVQPVRAENELANITRYSEPIRNVQWFKDYEHIIFTSGRFTKIIELDPRDHRNCMDLISTELEKPFVRYNNSLEILYFTEKNGDSTNLQSIIFPEPTPILGIGG